MSSSLSESSLRRDGSRAQRHPAHLVVAAVARILLVVLLLICLLGFVARNADGVSSASKRADLASSVAADLEAVGQANVDLEMVFESAGTVHDLSARTAEFGTANATGIKGTGAFSTYVQRSMNLSHESADRVAYQRATNAWDDLAAAFGPKLINPATSPAAITATLGRLRVLQDARQARLAELRGLYVTESSRQAKLVARTQRDVAALAAAAIAVVLAVGLGVMIFETRRAARRTKERIKVEGQRAATARRTDFEARVQRSMALAVDEAGVLSSMTHTLEAVGYRGAEFLTTVDESGDWIRAVAPISGDGCGVGRASDCPAVRLRQRLDFPDADAIDACPYLRERSSEVHQCVCVPVTIADETQAVLRTEAPTGESLTTEEPEWIAILARNVGEKISALRAFANSQHQAATDSLTGLANRRSLEAAIVARITSGTYAALFADIDHFKDLNDTFGHEIGDDCLRAFARVLERATRPGDLCARYGGEEFVVLLPTATKADAERVAERIQTFLVEELRSAHLAPFTVSIGIASTEHSASVEEVIRAADHAMFDAKAAGRNRIVAELV